MKRPSVERANARIRRLVLNVHTELDAEHAKPSKQHPDLQCREGCAHAATGCCSLITLLEIAEAEYIVDRNPAAVERALPALLEADRRITEIGLGVAELTAMWQSKEAEGQMATRYHAAGIVCPFLGDDRRCTIYQDRPIACRTHFVLSPPEECDAIGVNMRHKILDKGTRHYGQAWLIQNVMRERAGTLVFGTLPQLVLVVLGRRRLA